MTARRYFRRHWADCTPVIELFESLAAAAAEEEAQDGGRATAFQPHLSAGALEDGLANGSLMRVFICHDQGLPPPQSHRCNQDGHTKMSLMQVWVHRKPFSADSRLAKPVARAAGCHLGAPQKPFDVDLDLLLSHLTRPLSACRRRLPHHQDNWLSY